MQVNWWCFFLVKMTVFALLMYRTLLWCTNVPNDSTLKYAIHSNNSLYCLHLLYRLGVGFVIFTCTSSTRPRRHKTVEYSQENSHFKYLIMRELWLIDWLIDYLLFYVPLKNFSLIWRRDHCRWRVAKFRPMLGAQGLWAGRDLYRATPTVTRDLSFFRSHPKNRPI
jgi:hypothetical protein